MNVEFGQIWKLMELLKRIAPSVTRVAVLRNFADTGSIGQFWERRA
jgi:hypothetical protein